MVFSPLFTTESVAEKLIVGAGVVITATATELVDVPPLPVHDNVNVAFTLNGPTVSDPDVPLLPDQLPFAVQPLAF